MNHLEIPPQIDDLPISPEAVRVYVAIARSIAEHQEFPSIERITARCFGKKYALGKTHTNLALCELIKFNVIQGEADNFQVTEPEQWKFPGEAA